MMLASASWFTALSTLCFTPRRLSSLRELLGLLDRDGADQHRLLALVALGDLLDDGVELPFIELFRFQDDRHPIVNLLHKRIARGRHDREGAPLFGFTFCKGWG